MAKLLAMALAFGLMGFAGASELWWCEVASPATAGGADKATPGSAGTRPTDSTGLMRSKIDGHDSSAWSFLTELAASAGGGDVSAPQATPYADLSNVLSQDVVPEPTGGLLVLLGAMALGLRRKSDV